MAINRDFFSKPIVIPCTVLNSELLEGQLSQVQEKLYFTLRREKSADSTGSSIVALVEGQSLEAIRFTRFCNLLTQPPVGFDDFPTDARHISERAKEYFASDDFEPIIRAVMIFYDRALYPLELFG